jgi:hypothetical protein
MNMGFMKKLDQYSAFLYPNQGKQSGRINLFCDDHRLFLVFVDPGELLGDNSFDVAKKEGVAFQRFNQYRHFLDLLRNEKPIWVTFIPEDAPPSFVVFCANEPPGESEI